MPTREEVSSLQLESSPHSPQVGKDPSSEEPAQPKINKIKTETFIEARGATQTDLCGFSKSSQVKEIRFLTTCMADKALETLIYKESLWFNEKDKCPRYYDIGTGLTKE